MRRDETVATIFFHDPLLETPHINIIYFKILAMDTSYLCLVSRMLDRNALAVERPQAFCAWLLISLVA